MKTLTELRESFWESHPHFISQRRTRRRHNDYPCDTRCAFVDYVDMMHRDGQISSKLAFRASL